MKKSLLFIAILSFAAGKMTAQDEAIFNHYIVNPTLINPAYAGSTDKFQIFGHYRAQFSDFKDAPRTYNVSFNGPIAEKVGLGAMVLSEKYGVMDRLRAQLSYAYHYVNEKKGVKIGVGFSTEFHQRKLDPSVLSNVFYDKGDRIVETNIRNESFFDATLGAYADFGDKFYVSLSSPNLVRARVGTTDGDSVKSDPTFLRQFVLWTGYRYKMDKITLEPSLQMRRVLNAPFEVDLNLMARFLDDKFVAGFTFRPGPTGAFGITAGVRESFFQIYYSYNASLAEVNAYGKQAHEITLGIEFAKGSKDKTSPTEKKKKRYKN